MRFSFQSMPRVCPVLSETIIIQSIIRESTLARNRVCIMRVRFRAHCFRARRVRVCDSKSGSSWCEFSNRRARGSFAHTCDWTKGKSVQFGAVAVQTSRATLGRSFKNKRESHVLVLSTQKMARRRVLGNSLMMLLLVGVQNYFG